VSAYTGARVGELTQLRGSTWGDLAWPRPPPAAILRPHALFDMLLDCPRLTSGRRFPESRKRLKDARTLTMACPPIVRSLVIAEDARLAAQMSCALAEPGHYLPVVEGPRLLQPDPTAELVRRNNTAGRVRPQSIFMTGASDKAYDALTARFAGPLRALIRRISTAEEIESTAEEIPRLADPTRFKGPR
jgi:hypothetical protein